MKIHFENVDIDAISAQMNLLESKFKLLKSSRFEDLELTEENLKEAKEIISAYNTFCTSNWNIKPIKIILTNSAGTEIVNIK